ncbi:uncharacterized protein LOC144391353 [Gasterosteus aculeatus]
MDQLQINLGLMTAQKGVLKPSRGKTIPLSTVSDVTAQSLLHQSVKKIRDFNPDLDEGAFILLYADASKVINTPGTQRPFILEQYQAELGKPCARTTIFICPKKDFEEVGKVSDISDTEIVIKRPLPTFDLADTLPCEPVHESTPIQTHTEDIRPSTSGCPGMARTYYSNYTDLYALIVIDDNKRIQVCVV